MGIVRPVDSGYKGAVGVADGTAWQFKVAQPGSEYCVQPGSPRLLDRVREAIRLRHYCIPRAPYPTDAVVNYIRVHRRSSAVPLRVGS
ncbi:MAG: hypothetical protein HY525_18945 [Betaproteobacteria bacterium]|nr:hypothetical protein [Betaproteobacteria bacterium]